MDIDLPEDAGTGVNETMLRVRGNYDNVSRVNFARVITDSYRGGAFERERHLDI